MVREPCHVHCHIHCVYLFTGVHLLLSLGDGAVDAVQRQQGDGPGGEEVQPQRLQLLRVRRHHLQEAHQGAEGPGELLK